MTNRERETSNHRDRLLRSPSKRQHETHTENLKVLCSPQRVPERLKVGFAMLKSAER